MEIWYAIPSCNIERANQAFEMWKKQGYKTAVLLDPGAPEPKADLVIHAEKYGGYYKSFIALHKAIGDADIIITGGDDIFPDTENEAQKLGEEFFEHFPDGFGIMQPLGDEMEGIDRICNSPWFGKGWLKRAYQGRHAVWPEYVAFFGDQELKELSEKMGVLWQREDLVQYHDHWCRPGGPKKTTYQSANDKWWDQDLALINRRRTAGWPGSEPSPA